MTTPVTVKRPTLPAAFWPPARALCCALSAALLLGFATAQAPSPTAAPAAAPPVPVVIPVSAPTLGPALPSVPNNVPSNVPALPVPALPVPAPVPTAPVTVPAVPVIPVTPAPPVVTPPVVTPPPVTVPPVTVPPVTVPPITVNPPVTPPTVRNAVRGLWVDGFGVGLKSRAQVTTLIRDAQRLGINTLFVQTIRRADCLCNRALVPRVADRDLEGGFDPLDEVIAQAHAQNIRVIAWVSVTGAGSASAPNTSPQHMLTKHGPAAAGAQSWVNRRIDGSYLEGGDIWLDPGNAAAHDYMAQAVISLVKNYAIDGLQFDRIRYPDGGDWGYTPAALSRFRAETGARGVPLPSDPMWANWKREQITALVRRVALEARIQKPNLWISAATITYGAPPADLAAFEKSRTYSDVYQNWPAWTASGLVDLNVTMNYKQDTLPNHIAWFDGWNTFALKVAGRADVAAGAALYLNMPAVSRAQMSRALDAGLGWVGYAYRTPNVDVYKGQIGLAQGLEQLRKALSDNAGPLRPTAWQQNPPQRYGLLGRVRGLNAGWREVEVLDSSGKVLSTGRTDANGYYGFADLPAGVAEVRVAGQRWIEPLQKFGVARVPDLLLREVQIVPPVPSVSVGRQ